MVWWRGALDRYVASAPSPQNALDIFEGAWTSRLPSPFENARVGATPLFEDERLAWAIDDLGGFDGARIVELGPLEGGHTYMLQRAGAASVVAIEGNRRAYLKCLVVKELLALQRARFLCGDFVEYLRSTDERFDICIASGVLYHMRNPVELIELISRRAKRLYLWTHVSAGEATTPKLRRRLGAPYTAEHASFVHELRRYNYGLSPRWAGFCGGSNSYSNWLSRHDLFEALEFFGWSNVHVNFDDPDHPNGPALALTARRDTLHGSS